MVKEEIEKFRKEYNNLSPEEKVKKLEVLCQHYCGWLGANKESYVVDATKFWHEFEEK